MGADQRSATTDRQMTQDGARRDVAHFPSSSPSTIPAASTTDNSRITASTSLSPPSTERRMRSRAGYSQ